MDPYIAVLIGFGILVLMTAWVPMLLKEAPLSLPIVCVGIGAVVFYLPGLPGSAPNVQDHLPAIERLTELVVIISLLGAGLKISRPFGWRAWALTWRLLAVSMPLTIGGLALLAYALLGVSAASALLLAAALAPTDPVLASDIQVGRPSSKDDDDTRFALTSEAGLNDGLAFPFVNAAIALAILAGGGKASLLDWLAIDLVWKLVAGIIVGLLCGWALGWLLFHLPNRAKLSRTGDGFVALGLVCLTYGLTEAIHGYGFLAVFVAGCAIRAAERNHEYHETLHDFAEQLERLLMMCLLVAFGGALSAGGLLDALNWQAVTFGLLSIFVVRPISGWLGLARLACPNTERAVISFYGIRGLGSLYYLAYAFGKAPFPAGELIWSTAAFVILVSIVLHGVTVTPVMRLLDWRQKRGQARAEASELRRQGLDAI